MCIRDRIKDVSFVGGGSETWATQGSSGDNRYLQSASGQQLLVRNSGKSKFCTEKLPAGTGTVVGVLQWFSNDWQFVFRTNADCYGFSAAPTEPEAPSDGLNETFTGGIPTSWTNEAAVSYTHLDVYKRQEPYCGPRTLCIAKSCLDFDASGRE